MPRQCLAEQVRGVLATGGGHGPVEVVLQCGLVVRMRTVIDDFLRAAPRREAAEIGESLRR